MHFSLGFQSNSVLRMPKFHQLQLYAFVLINYLKRAKHEQIHLDDTSMHKEWTN